MADKRISLAIFIVISVALWLVNLQYPHTYIENAAYTAITIAILHFVFGMVLEERVGKRIKDRDARYSFRKTISIIYGVISFIVIITIWVEDPQALFVAYGLVGAGIAIALQDFFKNIAGGLVLFLLRTYKVGDRIAIDSKIGDVIDIDVMYTTIMEIQEWVGGDMPTGRLTIIPNGYILTRAINNYTKDHSFIWDEITIPITYDSDWKKAHKKILEIVNKETRKETALAEKQISRMGEVYYLEKRVTKPNIFITLTDNWITFSVRYITEVRNRRQLQNKLSSKILEMIQKTKRIKIASSTMSIVGFPDITMKKKK